MAQMDRIIEKIHQIEAMASNLQARHPNDEYLQKVAELEDAFGHTLNLDSVAVGLLIALDIIEAVTDEE